MVKTNLVPLDEAIFKFTREYIAPKSLLNSQDELKKITEIEGTGWRFATAAMIAISAIGEPFIERSRRFEILSKKIRNGRLMAYGLRTKPTTGTAPEQIPSFLFDNAEYLPLEKGIEKAGHRYELVQVSKGPFRKPKNQFTDAVASPRGVGRPTKDGEIETAINSLMDGGFNFLNEPRNVSYDAIRERAKKLGSNIKFGFSNPVLQRNIVRRFGVRK